MKKGVTIKDIARKLNMSVSTVSKALNDHPSISVLTKERVKKLADEWVYIPNEAARHFKQNKSFTIGVIMPDLLDQFYVLAINGVEEVAVKNNYNVVVSQSHEDSERETGLIENMIRNRVDGVIIAVTKKTWNTEKFKRLNTAGIPMVFFSRSISAPEFDYVSTDNEDGALQAMNFLFNEGHRRIAHLMGPPFLRTSQQRFDGYKKALAQKGIPFDTGLVAEVDFTQQQTVDAVKRLMKLKDPPTAFFTFKSYVGLDVIKILREKYPKMAGKMSIIGFGNLPLIQYLEDKLMGSIDENSFQMGVEAAQLIFDRIDQQEADEEPKPKFIKVPCKIVVH